MGFEDSPFENALSDSGVILSADELVGLDKEILEVSSNGDDDVPSAGAEDEQPSSASRFFAALFPSNVGLSLTMTAVILSIPVPSFIVSGARQCSNNFKNKNNV